MPGSGRSRSAAGSIVRSALLRRLLGDGRIDVEAVHLGLAANPGSVEVLADPVAGHVRSCCRLSRHGLGAWPGLQSQTVVGLGARAGSAPQAANTRPIATASDLLSSVHPLASIVGRAYPAQAAEAADPGLLVLAGAQGVVRAREQPVQALRVLGVDGDSRCRRPPCGLRRRRPPAPGRRRCGQLLGGRACRSPARPRRTRRRRGGRARRTRAPRPSANRRPPGAPCPRAGGRIRR